MLFGIIETEGKRMRTGDFIITYKQIEFWPLDPREEEVDIEDIGHALGMLCRYNGHVKKFYSIGEHSVRASYIVPIEIALPTLLHDGEETFLSDIPSPTKIFMPQYKVWGNNLQSVIYKKYGLPEEEYKAVKEADRIMLLTEMRDLIPGGIRKHWKIATSNIIPLDKRIKRTMSPRIAERLFLARFNELYYNQKLSITNKLLMKYYGII